MGDVLDIAKDVVASIDTKAGFLLAIQWVDKRYKQLASRVKLRHLRETDDIDLSGGGSEFDAPADLVWYGTVRYFDGTVYQRIVHPVTIEELDDWYPTRTAGSDGPYVYADKGLNALGTARNIEIYPAAQAETSEVLSLVYWEEPTTLTISSDLPLGLEAHNLREGVLVDLFRFEWAAAIRRGQLEIAQYWANQLTAQEARWERAILDVATRSRGVDDETLFMQQQSRAEAMIAVGNARYSKE